MRACALIGAVVLAAAVVSLQLFSNAPAPEPSQPRANLGPADAAGAMILLAPLLVVWTFSVCLRCSDAATKRYLVIIAILLICWLGEVLVKYRTANESLTIAYWYLYYVPMIFVPTLCLFSALRMAAIDRAPTARAIKRAVIVVDCLLLGLVLTNNLHHLVFAFDVEPGSGSWNGAYSYVAGYWAVFAWIVSLFTMYFGVLFVAARNQLRSAFSPVLVIACSGFCYALLYALRAAGMQTTNLAFSFSIIVLVGLELCLDFGLLPSYVWYGEAFRKLPFDLRIRSLGCREEFKTDRADLPPPVARDARSSAEDERPTFTVSESYRITGGTVSFSKDVTATVERRRRLEHQQNVLRRRNLMLERSRAIQSRLYRQKAEQELFAQVEQSLIATTDEIKLLLSDLPEGSDPPSAHARHAKLTRVKLLVAYCKRKASLLFAEKSADHFNMRRFQLAASETSADLRAIGVDCIVTVDTEATLSAAAMDVLHDCLHGLGLIALSCEDPLLAVYLHDHGARHVELSAVLQSSERSKAFQAHVDALQAALDVRDAAFRLDVSDDQMRLTVLASRKEA